MNRYTSENVPAGPPALFSAEVRDFIGIGQGDDSGGATSETAHHRSERVWEREGDQGNQQYDAMFEELSSLRGNQPSERLAAVVNDISNLPVGLKLRMDIRGLSIGELCEELIARHGHMWLRGLYLYAVVRDLHLMEARSEEQGVHFNTYFRDTRVRYVPLWRVLPVLPISGGDQFFTGGTLSQHLAGMKRLFSARLVEMAKGGYFDSELYGSDVASFFILDEVSLVRRNNPPEYMDTRISPVRTGGFSEILPTSHRFTFSLEELELEYARVYPEVYPTHLLDLLPEKLKNLREVLMKKVFLDGLLYPIFTLVVPGGVRCCVDTCIDELMDVAREHYDGLPLDLPFSTEMRSSDARVSAREAYVEERVSRLGKKRNSAKEVTHSKQWLQNKMGKEFDKATRLGYSSFYFSMMKKACAAKISVEPRLFYERFEEDKRKERKGHLEVLTMDNSEKSSIMVRRRLQEVGNPATPHLTVSKSDEDYSPLDVFEVGGVLKLCLFRITVNGQVHRHYPKSYYVFNTRAEDMKRAAPFLADDAECGMSGLLHAIGVFPYLPTYLLSEKVFLQALFNVIERHTKELMRVNRSRSVGHSNITENDIRFLVDYQNKRYNTQGLVSTLIYGERDEAGREKVRAGLTVSERNQFVSKPLVIAYDIETVELTEEGVSAVNPRFLVVNPDTSKYTQVLKQIPYMVQWVPVNLSDEGSLLAKKVKNGFLPRVDEPDAEWTATEMLYSLGHELPWWTGGLKKYKKSWIMLDEARLEYGGDQLGQCVEDFIQNATEWAVKHGYTSVKCFAHNGAAFDAHIVQAYNTKYAIKKILDVRGSLLGMSILVPVVAKDGLKNVTFSFADTKKFLAGSLDALCRDFKVPEAWAKIDFPITRIHWRNCYHSDIKDLVASYARNDVYSLAFVVKQINRMLCMHPREVIIPGVEEWVSALPFDLNSPLPFEDHMSSMALYPLATMKPPIFQFCTIMAFVKRVLRSHVNLWLAKNPLLRGPLAVDVPALRHWIDMGLTGGRVSAYAKVYASTHFNVIREAWMCDDKDATRALIHAALQKKDCMRVLDMTSLYPSAMTYCPLPMGKMFPLSKREALSHVDAIDCERCATLMTLCPKHRMGSGAEVQMRPFSVILVTNLRPTPEAKASLIHLVGRKIKPITYRANGGVPLVTDNFKKSDGVSYSVETDEEATYRLWGEPQEGVEWNVHGATTAYSNVDLYWARVCGFEFEVVGGFSWEMSGVLSDLYSGLFALRARAKADQNFSLQIGLKNVLNGGYGVHCQKLINSRDKVVSPGELYQCDIKDERMTQYLRDNHHNTFDSRFLLKDNIPLTTRQSFVKAKMPTDLGEVIGGSSPNHIGVAVLAWSRHLMNLVMVPLLKRNVGNITYTDTDSMALHQETYDFLVETAPHLIDESGRTMGTFKNDHSEIFKNAVVLFSAFGGKKVKMHVVGCPDTGELKICNTYKGFMCEGTDLDGRRYSKDRADFAVSLALVDILFDGKPGPHMGTRWSRNLSGGVIIEKGIEFCSETSEAYIGHTLAYTVIPDVQGLLVACVPHGSTYASSTFRYDITASLGLGDEWRDFLESQGVSRLELMHFLEKVHHNRNGYYAPTDDEDGIWGEMNEVLDDVEGEIQENQSQDHHQDYVHPVMSPFSPGYDCDNVGSPFSTTSDGDEIDFGFDFDFDFGFEESQIDVS